MGKKGSDINASRTKFWPSHNWMHKIIQVKEEQDRNHQVMHGPFAINLQTLLRVQNSNQDNRINLPRNLPWQTTDLKLLQMVQRRFQVRTGNWSGRNFAIGWLVWEAFQQQDEKIWLKCCWVVKAWVVCDFGGALTAKVYFHISQQEKEVPNREYQHEKQWSRKVISSQSTHQGTYFL